MSNQFFQFKQFTVHQEHVAMKVTTDACLFGAVVDTADAETILDIGTGTGLLALMLAQRSQANIHAVEMAEAAFLKAKENIDNTGWRNRITVHHADIRTFPETGTLEKFDLIISNPPFFTNHLRSKNEKKNVARHTDMLSPEELLKVVLQLLNKQKGVFHLLLPPKEMEYFTAIAAAQNLLPERKLSVRNFTDSEVFRIISSFSFSPSTLQTDDIVIWSTPGNYSERFTELLRPYYLNL